MTNSRLSIALFIGGIAVSTGSSAQSQAQAGAQDGMEDIVVTAQRREERLQDVPIAVSAITAGQLDRRGISDIRTLTQSVPGLAVPTQGSVATPYLRGVGSNGADPNNEPSVATYIDGIYIAAPFANIFGLNNIDRVEVLKGPQGTLFGRNATGGVIQIVTRTPSYDPTVDMRIGYANYDEVSTSLYASTGLGDVAAVDIAAQYKDQGDGWGRNVFLNQDIYKKREYAFRSKLLVEPSDATRITVATDYGHNRNSLVEYQAPPGVIGLDGNVNYRGDYNTNNGELGYSTARQYGFSLRAEQEMSFANLVSISAYRNSKGVFSEDADGAPANLINATLPQRNRTLSQELQLGAKSGSPVNWLVGAFLFDSKSAYYDAVISGSLVGGSITMFGEQHTKSASIYGQATAEVLTDTNITGGLRYTKEKQSFDGSAGGFIAPTRRQDFGKWTWRVSLDHKFADQVMGYVSYNHGIKSGGFDLLSTGSLGYRPEQLDAYEVGLKTEFFGRLLRINASAFYYDYTDIQVQSFASGSSRTENAAGARVKGFDIDVEARPIAGLLLSGSVGYLDSKYTDFPNPVNYTPSPYDPPVIIANAKGNETTRAPKWTGNVGFTYTLNTGAGDFALNSSLYYNDGFFYDAGNRARQNSYTLINGSLDWTLPGGQVGLNLWVRNLTKELYYDQFATTGYGDLFAYAEPRRVGLTLRYKM